MNRKPSSHHFLHGQSVAQAVKNVTDSFKTSNLQKIKNPHDINVKEIMKQAAGRFGQSFKTKKSREELSLNVTPSEPKAKAKACHTSHKTVITISGPRLSKSIEFGKKTKKVMQFTALFLALFFFIGSAVIAYSATNIVELQNSVRQITSNYFLAVRENKALKDTLSENSMEQEKLAAAEDMAKALTEEEIKKEVSNLTSMTHEQKTMLLKNIPNGYPVEFAGVTSSYGSRNHPVLGRSIFHEGEDFRAQQGAPVFATADGIIEYARPDGGYGNKLIITHSYGFKTVYGHLSRFAVKGGDFVKKGQLVAHSGNTGLSAGPHLHYEVRFLGEPLNPSNFARWNNKNFEYLFTMERRIKWASLVEATKWQTTRTAQASSQAEQRLLASSK